MNGVKVPRLMLTAPASGAGKTTVMCALLALFKEQQKNVVAFKCGPDYIDPMFHRTVLKTPSHNLDMFLLGRGDLGRRRTQQLLAAYGKDADIALLEGAMGYYDGLGTTWENSAYDIARATATPAVLVVNGKGAALSLAAQIHGFQTFRPDNPLVGFIVNNVKKSVYTYFKTAWEEATGLSALGYVPTLPEAALPSRHLGLVTVAEIPDLQEKIAYLQQTVAATIDLERLVELTETAAAVPQSAPPQTEAAPNVRIAVARDEAFCFYYEAALDLLRQLGAELVYFSPLRDAHLPDCHGLYLGGGYPELHAAALAANTTLRHDIRLALQRQLPCIAECGGFMYLQESFTDGTRHYPWVGAIPGENHMTTSLTRFGYVTLTAQADGPFCDQGQQIPAHEFHYSDSTNNGAAFIAQKPTGKRHWPCIQQRRTLLAGYPHMHFLGCPDIARRFIAACRQYKTK